MQTIHSSKEKLPNSSIKQFFFLVGRVGGSRREEVRERGRKFVLKKENIIISFL